LDGFFARFFLRRRRRRGSLAKFASPEQLAAGVLDFVDGRVDVAG
jgi:hypothetical protein